MKICVELSPLTSLLLFRENREKGKHAIAEAPQHVTYTYRVYTCV